MISFQPNQSSSSLSSLSNSASALTKARAKGRSTGGPASGFSDRLFSDRLFSKERSLVARTSLLPDIGWLRIDIR